MSVLDAATAVTKEHLATAGLTRRTSAPRGRPLAALVFGLALVVMLPALLVAGLATWHAVRAQEAVAEARLGETAQGLALAVDREITGIVAALSAFAAAPAFARGVAELDLPAVEQQAERVAERLGAGIFVLRRDGTRLLASRNPAPLPVEQREAVEQLFVTGQPVVGNLVSGPFGTSLAFAVGVPVPGPEARLMVGAMLEPGRLRDLLAAQRLAPDAVAAMSDARNRLVARSDGEHDRLVGQPIPAQKATRLAGQERGAYRDIALDGAERVFAFHAVPSAPGWNVFVAESAVGFAAAARHQLELLAGGAAAALLAGLGVAFVAARRMLEPLGLLRDRALSLVAGPAAPAADILKPAPIAEIEQLRRGFAAAEATLRAREAELASLLDATGEGVFVLDSDWRITTVSGRGASFVPAEAGLRGRTLWEVFPEGLGGPLWDACRRTMAERVATAAPPFQGPLGQRLAAACHPRPDGGIIVVLRDVTQEGAAAQRLAESEARFRGLAEALPILAFETDQTGTSSWSSASWRDYTGLDAAALGRLGWMAAMHPDEMPGITAAWNAALRAGVPYVRHQRIRRADGAWRWHLVRALPVRGRDGAVTRWLGAAADVHELVEAEARIADSEGRLRALIELSPQVVWTADAEGRLTYASAAWWAVTGQDEAETLGTHGWLAALHPEDAERVIAAWQIAQRAAAAGRDGQYEIEFRLLRAGDDAWRWFLSRVRAERDAAGRLLRWVGVALDVDARKAAEARLAESEARLRLALEAGQVGIFSWDIRAGELVWDERVRALWALPPGAPVSLETFYAGLHPEDAGRVEEAIAAALDPASGVFEAEFRVVGLADGVERHVAGHARVEFAEGRPVRMTGVNHDVTPMRRAAQVLAREAAQLEALAERRAQALAESEARLAEAARMEALGRLAGGIAHDFNNVLQAVQGGLRLAERRLPGDPGGVRRYLAMASDAAARGASVTGRLLSFARRGALRAEAVAPVPLLEELAEMLRAALGPSVSVAVRTPPGLPALWVDRGQLESVLVNLANNARDAMGGEGEILLRAEVAASDGHDAPSGLSPGACVKLSVVDAGAGMAPEVLARVTEPFFTTKPRGQGTGLGLAMARGFAEQSGGALTIESAPGRGTTVSLWLPQADAAAGVVAARAPQQDNAPPGPRPAAVALLLAEDEPEVREILATELTERGFAVSAAADAAGALALLDGGLRPDAVVTDLAMPGGMDGLGLVEEARRRLPRLPAVLVTGHAGEASSERLAAVERGGPFALVRKPAATEVLVERLDRVLGERRALVAE